MYRRLLFMLAFGLLLVGQRSVKTIAQEDNTCPALVTEALEVVERNCGDTERNELCYGNTLLTTEFWEEAASSSFLEPADVVSVMDVRTIASAPLDIEEEQWGLALMRLQANIPETVPGQNVTFLLFGEVEVENAVEPDEVRPPITPIDVTARTGVNLRGGPSTNFGIMGSMTAGQTLPAIGRNARGDWLQVLMDDTVRVWVSADFVNADGDLSTLPDVAEGALFGPMEAFYFRSGFGEPACVGAPPDHILVNSPEGLEVSFTANGVNFTVGSVGALRTNEDTMTVTTFDGSLELEAAGFTATVPQGFEIDVPLGGGRNGLEATLAPTRFRPYDREEWAFYEDIGEDSAIAGEFELPEEPVIIVQDPNAPVGPEGALGSGDVQVTLTWDNLADMDLAVVEPGGAEIYFANRFSPSGGQLDVDSNFPCGSNTFQVENIFWPSGQAPSGTYTVYVNQYSTCGAGNANWTLTVRLNGQVVLSQSGTGGSAQFNFSR